MLFSAKGNGIKDGFVRWACVYAVVFWMLRFRGAILQVILFFKMDVGTWCESWGMVVEVR